MGIKLVKRQISAGRYSLYLSTCVNGTRKKESLGIILEKGHDKVTKELNKIKISIARSLQIKKELDFLLKKIPDYTYSPPSSQDSQPDEQQKEDKNLFEIFSEYIDSYNKADIRILKASYNHNPESLV